MRVLREHEWNAIARGENPSLMSIVRMRMIAVKLMKKTMKSKHDAAMKRRMRFFRYQMYTFHTNNEYPE